MRVMELVAAAVRLRVENANLRVENARLRASLAWAWFAIAAISLAGCYVLLVMYGMEACR